MKYINITYCIGTQPIITRLPVVRWKTVGDNPDWLILVYDLPSTSYFTHAEFSSPGVYDVVIESGEGQITITITAINCNPPALCVPRGCTTNIAWLNLEGGWSSYVFSSAKKKKTEEVEIKEYFAFKQYDNVTGDIINHAGSIYGIKDKIKVVSGFIPASHLPFLKALRFSVCQYLFNDITENFDIPIMVIKDDFVYRLCNNGFAEYNFSFIVSTEYIVQTQ